MMDLHMKLLLASLSCVLLIQGASCDGDQGGAGATSWTCVCAAHPLGEANSNSSLSSSCDSSCHCLRDENGSTGSWNCSCLPAAAAAFVPGFRSERPQECGAWQDGDDGRRRDHLHGGNGGNAKGGVVSGEVAVNVGMPVTMMGRSWRSAEQEEVDLTEPRLETFTQPTRRRRRRASSGERTVVDRDSELASDQTNSAAIHPLRLHGDP